MCFQGFRADGGRPADPAGSRVLMVPSEGTPVARASAGRVRGGCREGRPRALSPFHAAGRLLPRTGFIRRMHEAAGSASEGTKADSREARRTWWEQPCSPPTRVSRVAKAHPGKTLKVFCAESGWKTPNPECGGRFFGWRFGSSQSLPAPQPEARGHLVETAVVSDLGKGTCEGI